MGESYDAPTSRLRRLNPFDKPLLTPLADFVTTDEGRPYASVDGHYHPDDGFVDWLIDGDLQIAPWDIYHHTATKGLFYDGSIYGDVDFQWHGTDGDKHRAGFGLGYGTCRDYTDEYFPNFDPTKRNFRERQPYIGRLSYVHDLSGRRTRDIHDSYSKMWGLYVTSGGTKSFVLPETTFLPYPMRSVGLVGGFYSMPTESLGMFLFNAEISGAIATPNGTGEYRSLSSDSYIIDPAYQTISDEDEPKDFVPTNLEGVATYMNLGMAMDYKSGNHRIIPSISTRILLDEGSPLVSAPVWVAGSLQYIFKTPDTISFPHSFTLEAGASSSFFNSDDESYGNTFRASAGFRAWLKPMDDLYVLASLGLATEGRWGDSLEVHRTQDRTLESSGEKIYSQSLTIHPFYGYGGTGGDFRAGVVWETPLRGKRGGLDIGGVFGLQYLHRTTGSSPTDEDLGIFIGLTAAFKVGGADSL